MHRASGSGQRGPASTRRRTIASITSNLRKRSVRQSMQNGKTGESSISAFLEESVGEAFQQALPFKFLQRSERTLVSIVGAAFYVVLVVSFCALFAYSFVAYRYSPYISAEYESARCTKVGATITGTFIGGYDGKWRLENDANNNLGLYKLALDNFRVDDESDFKEFIASLDTEYLSPIGLKMSNQTLISNLLYLLTFRADVAHNGYKQVFTFSATPSAVFNMFRYQTQLASYNATCGYSGAATGSKGTYRFEYMYSNYIHQYTDYDRFHDKNATAYEANSYGYSTCHSIAPVTADIIAHRLDMESFTTAMAINLGIMNATYLAPIDEEYRRLNSRIAYKNVTYFWFYSFNLRFPNAAGLKCLRKLSGDDSSFVSSPELYCLVDYAGNFYGIPVLDSYGMYNATGRRYDRCACPSAEYGSSYYSGDCLLFDFQGGIIFFPKAVSSAAEWASLLDLITGYTADQLQAHGYTLSRHAFYKYWKEKSDFYRKQTSYYRGYSLGDTDAFAFCNNTCVISAFNLYNNYDMYFSGRIISEYLYTLFNLSTACNNFVQSPKFSGLFVPPVPLVELYYSCIPTLLESLLFSMGAAQGTLQSLTLPALLLVLAPALYGFMYLMSILPQRQPFSEQERQSVLGLLSEVVLEERDDIDNGIAEGSLLRKLAMELLARAATLDDVEEKARHPARHLSSTRASQSPKDLAAVAQLYSAQDASAVAVEMVSRRESDSGSDGGSDVHDWKSRCSDEGPS